jgi:hypothetical protein
MAPSSPKSPSYQNKLAAARAVGLDGNANWAQIRKAEEEQAAKKAAQQATQRANEARAAATLAETQRRNEETQRRNEEGRRRNENALQGSQARSLETLNRTYEQKEKEQMIRTFQTRRRGRAALRIKMNTGNSGSSSYEGSSGISISM